jgi:prefoldin subunit 5
MEVSGLRTLKTSQGEVLKAVNDLAGKLTDLDDRITANNSAIEKVTSQMKQVLVRLDKVEKDLDTAING